MCSLLTCVGCGCSGPGGPPSQVGAATRRFRHTFWRTLRCNMDFGPTTAACPQTRPLRLRDIPGHWAARLVQQPQAGVDASGRGRPRPVGLRIARRRRQCADVWAGDRCGHVQKRGRAEVDQSRVADYCMFAGEVLAGHEDPGVAASRMPGTAEGAPTMPAGKPALRRFVTRAAGREKGRDNQRCACAWAGISVMLCGRAVASSRLRESLPHGQGSNGGPADAGRAARRKVVRVGVAIAHRAQASAR